MRAARLLGRRSECEALDRALAAAAEGSSQVLVLRGDAGVGKTALLRYLSDRVTGWRVVTAVGVESEMELAYSGLHQLCAPLVDGLERLSVPQRQALATALGLSTGPAPDRFLVGLATLTLLADAAEQQPLVCIVDDAHWLDHASAQILAFVARRLLAERIALVCAARTGIGDDALAGMPALPVRGLGDSDARTLLLDNVHGPLDPAVCDQIVMDSHGNPLALLELPRTWRTVDLAGGYGLPERQPVASRIEQSYVRRLLPLPSSTRLLVLAAAAEPLGDPALLARAAQALGIDMAAAAPAVDAGLLQVRGRVEFTHPLVRSATYRSAAAADRYRVHRVLAEVTDAEADPDRRAWHRARATPGPDEGVAADLESSAGRAQSRGGLAAAATFLTRATELTPVPAVRVRRALGAAAASVQAGAFDAAREMLTIAGGGPADDMQRARIDMLRAQLAFASSRGNEATPLLLAAARRLEPLDVELARQTYLDALTAALFVARMSAGAGLSDVAQAVRGVPRRSDAESTAGDLLLDALTALLTDDYDTAVPICAVALRRLGTDRLPPGKGMRWLWLGCAIASDLWDDDSWYVLANRHLLMARETGALSELPHALNSLATILVFCGDLPSATSMLEEGQSVQDATGISTAPYAALGLAAWRGEEDVARGLIERTIRDAGSRGEGWGVSFGEYTHALLCNGLGDYDEALVAAGRAREYSLRRAGENWALPELIESATRTGRTDLATDSLRRLTSKARGSGTDWALGIAARSRALLREGDAAERLFREAIEHLSRTRVRGELARAHLLYGEWLRRANRRVDARHELHTAFEMFNAMTMTGFAERARRELLATGATVRKKIEPYDDLTEQEAQIARLARNGMSNPEIGVQLFLSARTVEWHLRKVFTKLGISSRRELRRALSDSGRLASL